MSFFRKLFGGGAPKDNAPPQGVDYKGFMIAAQPYKEGGQWQLAGVIWKEVNGERKEHRFIRADKFTGKDEAAEIALAKARQIIDEQGERIFT